MSDCFPRRHIRVVVIFWGWCSERKSFPSSPRAEETTLWRGDKVTMICFGASITVSEVERHSFPRVPIFQSCRLEGGERHSMAFILANGRQLFDFMCPRCGAESRRSSLRASASRGGLRLCLGERYRWDELRVGFSDWPSPSVPSPSSSPRFISVSVKPAYPR